MKFDIISLFPKFFEGPFSCGILRIAQEKGSIDIHITNPRDFTDDRVVDDYQFGGGAGMVLKPDPLCRAIKTRLKKRTVVIYLTPRGDPLTQERVKYLTQQSHILIVCGRYKGIDERIKTIFKPLELSLGDYIISGGESGALVLIEAITRLLPGVLGNRDSAESDSFQGSVLGPPIYTRPARYEGLSVPEILRSGDHRRVAHWRREKTLEQTLKRRPDLLSAGVFTKKDFEILLEVLDGRDTRD